MSPETSHQITVLDFRRRRMAVRWDIAKATWTSHEEAVALVHGIALIRPDQPGVCLFGYAAQLTLQIGDLQLALGESAPVISCEPELLSAGLRRVFRIEAPAGGTLYEERYWAGNAPDFLRALAEKAADPQWRLSCARLWSDGVEPALLRQGWPG
jgi:hypothetical protein